MSKTIDTDRFSALMRRRGIDTGLEQVAITRLDGSLQEQDLSEPANCAGLGRIRHFRRETSPGWPENPLPIEPAARALGLGGLSELRAQVFQNAVCNWRCWYCYVDFELLSANPAHTEMHTATELVDLYLAETGRPLVLDLSGGQPDLVPEWVAWMLEALRDRGVGDSVYLWSDDNLSNDYFFSLLDAKDRERIEAAELYGKVCCLKGFDEESFAFNTSAAPELFERQLQLLERLVLETEIDLYCYGTFTAPSSEHLAEKMNRFLDRLQEIHPRLPLRLVPLEIREFTPLAGRLGAAHRVALEVQAESIGAWNQEIESRFGSAQRRWEICDVKLDSD